MIIPRFVVFQVLALVLTACLYGSLIYQKASLVLYCVTFSHYVLALIYSRQYIKDIVQVRQNYLPFALLALAGFGLISIGVSAYYFFAIHHALNESYIRARFESKGLPNSTLRLIQPTGFFLHLAGYMILGSSNTIKNEPLFMYYLMALIVSSIIYFALIFRARRYFSAKQLLTVVFAEVLLFGLLIVDFTVYDINFFQIICYHVLFWVFFPAGNIWTHQSYKSLGNYALLTVLTIGIFVYLSPFVTQNWSSDLMVYRQQFEIWSYFHILSSFALSKANPAWINNRFKDQKNLPA